jgi:hypothetical protein
MTVRALCEGPLDLLHHDSTRSQMYDSDEGCFAGLFFTLRLHLALKSAGFKGASNPSQSGL